MNMDTEVYQKLLERVEKAELEAARARAVTEIQNVASKFFWYHASFADNRIIEEGLWARNAPDIHAEFGVSGVYKGYENVIKFHLDRPRPAGKMLFHAIDTPIIEVAGDCKTAKGVWLLHGAEGGSVPADINKDGEVFPEIIMTQREPYDGMRTWAHWAWAKYAMDFILEDGKWRIWHFHGYDLMRAPWDMDWVSFAQRESKKMTQVNEKGNPVKLYDDKGDVVYMDTPDAPPTWTWAYDGATTKYDVFPEPPVPYETFDDTFTY